MTRVRSTSPLDREIHQIHELLFLRDLLADRGIPPTELQRYDAAIAAARGRLDEAARSASLRPAA